MIDKLNTHSYDGKINVTQLPDINIINKLSIEDKRKKGQQLLAELHINDIARNFLKIIISDIGTNKNIDVSNNINADDLICLCWHHRDNIDFVKVLESQLMDMRTGFCPQGRTHRLFQTLSAFT